MDTSQAPPAKWGYVVQVYDALLEEATNTEFDTGTEKKSFPTWEGHTTRLFQRLGVPTPYYGHVLGILQKMGCISQARRGGGSPTSQWVLWKPPVLEDFYKLEEAGPGSRRISQGAMARLSVLEQRVNDLKDLLGGVDVHKALFDLEREVRDVRAALATHVAGGSAGEAEGA